MNGSLGLEIVRTDRVAEQKTFVVRVIRPVVDRASPNALTGILNDSVVAVAKGTWHGQTLAVMCYPQ